MGTTRLIDRDNDTWRLKGHQSVPPFTFEFGDLPNEWFKETIKQITLESLQIGKLTLGTINRYHIGLKEFFTFIQESNYNLNTFKDLNPQIAEEYLHYLLMNVKANSTRAVKLAGLKYHLRFGITLGWSGFPINQLFDGTEYRLLQTEDTLKTMVIDDKVMKQINIALDRMNSEPMSYTETLIWGLITIIKATGMRIHEALSIQESHISKDLMGKPILEVLNEKTLTDRYIPISNEVVRVIGHIAKTTEPIRRLLDTDYIFVREINGSGYGLFDQREARRQLIKFMNRFNIVTPTGELAHLNFHQFRHTIGTDLLNNGMSMREVMEYLGHESAHSTRLYAKVQSTRFGKAYRKLGFIGVIEKSIDDAIDTQEEINKEQRLMAQLPDGVCARPIKEQVVNCKKPNACLFCPKFITTPEFLDFHKDHLERIRADKKRYIEENMIGTDYLLFETEKALVDIISRLEKILGAKGGLNNGQ